MSCLGRFEVGNDNKELSTWCFCLEADAVGNAMGEFKLQFKCVKKLHSSQDKTTTTKSILKSSCDSIRDKLRAFPFSFLSFRFRSALGSP